MSQVGSLSVPMSEACKGVRLVISIKGLKVWRVRLWLAALLIGMGARICPIEAEITTDTGQ